VVDIVCRAIQEGYNNGNYNKQYNKGTYIEWMFHEEFIKFHSYYGIRKYIITYNSSKMKIVTVATKSERYYPYLKESAERHNHEFVTLGWEQKWRGFGWRFKLMKEYLQSLPSNELICFIDGYDVILLQDPKTIEDKYNRLTGGDKTKIVCAIDRSYGTDLEKMLVNAWSSFYFYKMDSEMVNAGTYIGHSSTLLEIYDSMCKEFTCDDNSDDQIILQQYILKHKNQFIIDINNEIFLTVTAPLTKITLGKDNISFENNRIKYKDKYPSILHAPGNSDMDDIIEVLGYDMSTFRASKESKSKYIIAHSKGIILDLFKRYYYIWIFILILIVALVLSKIYKINIMKKITGIFRRKR
jgi:hypothetical protein